MRHNTVTQGSGDDINLNRYFNIQWLLVMVWFLYCSDAAILLWKLNDSKEPEQAPMFQEDEDAQLNKESWSVVKTLRYTTLPASVPLSQDIFQRTCMCSD